MFTVDSLQNQYLNDLVKNQSQTSVFLKNGIRLKDNLVGHTNRAVFLRDGITQLIQKNSISTIYLEIYFKNFGFQKYQ